MTDLEPTIDELRWAAVQRRDPVAEGKFVYGVTTTGVYCRPTCPSRRPLRRNVRFFDDAVRAEAAGLRPCRRCCPTGMAPSARRNLIVERACRMIEDAFEAPKLCELAASAGMSPHHFHRVFKAATGLTPKAYALALRTARVRAGLQQARTVTDAVYGAGYGAHGRFYDSAAQRLGMTPTEFRAGGPGVEVRFAVSRCSLGWIVVAATAKGLCAIELGDDPDTLVRDLQERFHGARLLGDDPAFADLVARVVALVEDPLSADDTLPLDIRGTAFQERVWQALRAVPAGSTITYSELAARIGSPAAVRAVGAACAANHVAIAVPCHRVVRTDGGLAGYRWGVERKRAMLEREQGGATAG